MAGVIASAIVPHTPRMADEDAAPDFVRPLIDGAREMGAALRAFEPDLFVVNSTHWVSTFNWYATSQAVHEGVCVADEAPDMVPGIGYRRAGDPDFANAFITTLTQRGVPCFANASAHYNWDYGSLVPLLYLDPDAAVPVVLIPTVILANLDEAIDVGRLVDAAAKRADRRVVHIASTALSHDLVRGPATWPTDERQALDRRFIELACAGDVTALISWLPEFARAGAVEMGGRVAATFLGSLDAMSDVKLAGRQFGAYGQSSGSGNVSLMVGPTE